MKEEKKKLTIVKLLELLLFRIFNTKFLKWTLQIVKTNNQNLKKKKSDFKIFERKYWKFLLSTSKEEHLEFPIFNKEKVGNSMKISGKVVQSSTLKKKFCGQSKKKTMTAILFINIENNFQHHKVILLWIITAHALGILLNLTQCRNHNGKNLL